MKNKQHISLLLARGSTNAEHHSLQNSNLYRFFSTLQFVPQCDKMEENIMEKVAKFYKISKERFLEDFSGNFPEIYDNIKLPTRATAGSAGYDFFSPFDFVLAPGETIKIPTGIRAEIKEGWVLMLYPRSGLGFKFRLGLDNTVGVIDSDYFYCENEGHIFAKITNNSTEGKTIAVKAGEGFIQGIFMPFGITVDDDATAVRIGGFGSTTKK